MRVEEFWALFRGGVPIREKSSYVRFFESQPRFVLHLGLYFWLLKIELLVSLPHWWGKVFFFLFLPTINCYWIPTLCFSMLPHLIRYFSLPSGYCRWGVMSCSASSLILINFIVDLHSISSQPSINFSCHHPHTTFSSFGLVVLLLSEWF